MMEIYRFQDQPLAQRFVDYLRSQGIACLLDEWEGETWRLIVLEDGKAERALRELALYINDPEHERYHVLSWEDDRPLPSMAIQSMPSSYWRRLWGGTGLVTAIVMIVCVLIFLLMSLDFQAVVDRMLFLDLDKGVSWHSPWWRLVSPALLHFSLAHLVFNLLWWWQLGREIEANHGGIRLFNIGMAAAIVSDLMQYYWRGPMFGGLSGVVFALAGYVWIYPKINDAVAYRLHPAIVRALLIWMFLGALGVFDVVFGQMANAAHLGGLLTGMVLAVIYAMTDKAARKGGAY